MIMNIICIIIILFVLVGCLYGHYSEAKDFNNGICPKCGNKLEYFDTDSQGGRGYCCRKCEYYTWVSWFADKKYRKKKE